MVDHTHPLIITDGVSKQYARYKAGRPRTIGEAMRRGVSHLRPLENFWALRDVSFNLLPGRTLGIIGGNGAGKSTLLRLIGGIGRPDDGRIRVSGRLGAFLNLRVGLRPELTGRENIHIAGVVAGLRRREVLKQFDEIVQFAEIEQFIDNPVRTFSQGMQMRLGFAIAAHANPEILLIDEALAVGDMAFQKKCLDRIATFKTQGSAICLVSHETEQIETHCDEVLWLKNGHIQMHGDPQAVVSAYRVAMEQRHREQGVPGDAP